MKTAKFLLILSLFIGLDVQSQTQSPQSKEPVFTATFYKKDSGRKEKLYKQEMRSKELGGKTIQTSVYKYADGREGRAVDERIIWDRSGFQKYVVEHHQLQERWVTDRFGGKIQFALYDLKTGEVKKDSEEMEENFVIGPMIIDYLRERWKKLMKGEDVKVRFAVPARLETIGFKFFREREVKKNGKLCVEIIMKPTNFLIALLVDPIKIYFDVKTKVLVQVIGRTIPRYKNGEDWDELDAEIDYFYRSL